MKYIKDECLVFKVMGFPDVKKQDLAETEAKRKVRKNAAAQNAIMGK